MSIQAVQNAGVTVGYVRKDCRVSMTSQRRWMDERGIDKVYRDWSLLIRHRRQNVADVIAVTDFFLVADPKRLRVRGGVRQSLIDRRREARQKGASILELRTGRSTLNPDEADDMLLHAMDVLAGTQSRSSKTGRKPKTYSDHEMTIMRLHWRSMEHRTNRIALAAMAADGVKVSVQIVTRILGPSGRKPGTVGPRGARKKTTKRNKR